MTVFKRHATVAYDLKNGSILSIESISSPTWTNVSASDLRQIYANALGPIPEQFNISDEQFSDYAARYMTQYSLGIILRLFKEEFPAFGTGPLAMLQAFLAIPLQFSTLSWQYFSFDTLPSDLNTTAALSSVTYRVIIPPWQFYIFASLVGVLFLSGTFHLCWVTFAGSRIPNSSLFPEMDILWRYKVAPSNDSMFHQGTNTRLRHPESPRVVGKGISRDFMDEVKGEKLFCGSVADPNYGQYVALTTSPIGLDKLKRGNRYVYTQGLL
jgi:hypothetical protein